MAAATAAKTPPGPFTLSPLGSVRDLQRDAIGALTDLWRQYGDVCRFRFGPWFSYLICHPDGVRQVLHENNRNYRNGYTFEFLKPLVGTGLLTSEGDFWLRQRRLAAPAFHRHRIEQLTTVMTDATTAMLNRWESYVASGATVDIAAEAARLTLQIVGHALFGTDVSGDAEVVGQSAAVAQEHINYRASRILNSPRWLPTPRNRRFRRVVSDLDAIVYRMIEKRRRDGGDHGDLLSMLILATDDESGGGGMTDRQLRDEVMTVFLAGHETTALALSWSWYLLSQHPAIEQRLAAEVSSVLGGRAATVADLPGLRYATMVIQETLRLYPPGWIIGREAASRDVVGGYEVPRGAQVFLSPYITHRHPAFWTDPDAFDPERFRPEVAQSRPRFAYFPFGGGPRLCIGNEFAMMEAVLILAMVSQRFSLKLTPGRRVEPAPLITLRVRNGLPMTVHERAPVAAEAAS